MLRSSHVASPLTQSSGSLLRTGAFSSFCVLETTRFSSACPLAAGNMWMNPVSEKVVKIRKRENPVCRKIQHNDVYFQKINLC